MRLKDADALVRTFRDVMQPDVPTYLNVITGIIEAMPTVDAEPVRHAFNLKGKEQSYAFRCSECHGIAIDLWANEDIKYCPFCGAKLDGVGANADRVARQ